MLHEILRNKPCLSILDLFAIRFRKSYLLDNKISIKIYLYKIEDRYKE